MNSYTEDERVTPKGMIRRSATFFKAGLKLDSDSDDKTGKFFPIEYYLFCHSVELSLKALLSKGGLTVKDLRKLGHNLEEIVKEVIRLELLTFQDQEILTIKSVNKMYYAKEFEYFKKGFNTIPHLSDIRFIAEKILTTSTSIEIASHNK